MFWSEAISQQEASVPCWLLGFLFNTEEEGSMFFPKAYDLLLDYTTSQMYSSHRLRYLTKDRHIPSSVGMLQDSYDYNCDYSEHTTGLKYDHDFKMGLDTKTD
jgi:hypothetical protein